MVVAKKWLYITYLVFSVLFLIWGINYSSSQAKESGFIKHYIARDLGLIIDTTYAAPGNLEINYGLEGEYKADINDNVVMVDDPRPDFPGVYEYSKDFYYNELEASFGFDQDNLFLKKENQTLNIENG